jgi:D-glycero-alpha-D-manno-heptose-7-phosphate kinase
MIISRTPFRMSYVGGGTDIKAFYKDEPGAVLSTAIDKYMYVTVHQKFDGGIRVAYSKTEEVSNIDDIGHPLVKESLKALGVLGGVEITSTADIPAKGTGLGSSSSYTVGLLTALHAYMGKNIPTAHLAELACNIEIIKCEEPIGKQDQYAAAFGGLNLFEFMPDDSVNISPVLCSNDFRNTLNLSTLVFYTGVTRSASGILAEQTRVSSQENKKLILRRMARLAYDFKLGIEDNSLEHLSELLKENWSLKKTLTDGITNSTIDEIYNAGIGAGAYAGKLLGAGAGGFVMFLAPENRHFEIINALHKLRPVKFNLESSGSKVIYYGE